MNINSQTKISAVIGYPLGHTLSPAVHNAALKNKKINMVFMALPVKDVKFAVCAMRTFNIRAFAVTMPHKQSVMKYLDRIDGQAKQLKNVNTVVNRNGKLYGYNTDIYGVEKALAGIKIKGRAVFIIGAGGAARTCAYVVRKKGGILFIVNRDIKEANDIAKDFKAEYAGGMEVLDKAPRIFPSLIINATPIGMGKFIDKQPVSSCYLKRKPAVFDLVYNPLKTKLLRVASAKGCKVITGDIMFISQAALQFELYTGKKAPVSVMKNAFRNSIKYIIPN